MAVCAVVGPPGIGKSYLVERFAQLQKERFPGGVLRLSFLPNVTPDAEMLFGRLGDRLRAMGGERDPVIVVGGRLRAAAALIHLEGADSDVEVEAAIGLMGRVTGCSVVVSGRNERLSQVKGWTAVRVGPLRDGEALDLIEKEHRPAAKENEQLSPLPPERRAAIQELARLVKNVPVALHVVASLLRETFPGSAIEAALLEQSLDDVPAAVLAVARDWLTQYLGEKAAILPAVLGALAYAPRAGLGATLGSAMASLGEEDFKETSQTAARFGILEERANTDGSSDTQTWRAHSAFIVFLRSPKPDVFLERLTVRLIAAPLENVEEELPPPGEAEALEVVLAGLQPERVLEFFRATRGFSYRRGASIPLVTASCSAACERAQGKAPALTPEARHELYALALSLSLMADDAQGALRAAKSMVALAGPLWRSWNVLPPSLSVARALLKLGNHSEAISFCRLCLSSQSEDPEAPKTRPEDVVEASLDLARALRRRGEPNDRHEAAAVLTSAMPSAATAGRWMHDRLITTPFIEHISIRNFKNLSSLDLDFTQPSELPGRWMCIAGLNGAGKSAVLQAISLVLLGDRLIPEMGALTLERMRTSLANVPVLSAEIGADVQFGNKTVRLCLPIGDQGVDIDRLRDEPDYKQMRELWDVRAKHHLLLAYGAGRNLSVRESVQDIRESQGVSPDVRRQTSLFDPFAHVASARMLLGGGEGSGPVFAMLKRLLADVVEELSPVIMPDGSLRFLVNGALVSPLNLPDGFRSLVAWLADICAAWHDKSPEEAADGDPSNIRGIVLVDEIDLHIHAGLQRVLVPRLRKALPEIQWIVTTHSPLVVSSFDRRELLVLDAGPNGPEARELDRQILGFSTDEVYRYLMNVQPHSGALEAGLQSGGGPNHGSVASILAQSPDVSEQQAREDRAWLDELARRVRERDAKKGPEHEGS